MMSTTDLVGGNSGVVTALGCPEMEKEKKKEDGESGANGGHEVDGGGGGEEKEKMVKEFSHASLSSMDEEEEEEEGGKNAFLLGPQVTIKEQLEMDKDDESLRRWKENLLGSVDLSSVGENAEPDCKIVSLTLLSPDRPDLVLPLPFEANNKASVFTLKDGSHYKLKFTLTVSNDLVVGLKYINTVWKKGVKVDTTKIMLGTFSPQFEPYTYELEEETTPSGFFARGNYTARTKFVDDDGKCYLDIHYHFEIRKEWPSSSSSSS